MLSTSLLGDGLFVARGGECGKISSLFSGEILVAPVSQMCADNNVFARMILI
jgi:hypothetical protein